jgi:hypothetical protein
VLHVLERLGGDRDERRARKVRDRREGRGGDSGGEVRESNGETGSVVRDSAYGLLGVVRREAQAAEVGRGRRGDGARDAEATCRSAQACARSSEVAVGRRRVDTGVGVVNAEDDRKASVCKNCYNSRRTPGLTWGILARHMTR